MSTRPPPRNPMSDQRLVAYTCMHYLPKLTAIVAQVRKTPLYSILLRAKVLYRNSKRQFNFQQNQVINGMFM